MILVFEKSVPAEATQEEIIERTVNYMHIVGIKNLLNRLSDEKLEVICKELKLKGSNGASRQRLLDAISTRSNVEHAPKKIKEIIFSIKKPKIRIGVTYQDLFQHYYNPELTDYCKKNDLTCTGSKKILINRILAHLKAENKENSEPLNEMEEDSEKEDEKQISKKFEQ